MNVRKRSAWALFAFLLLLAGAGSVLAQTVALTPPAPGVMRVATLNLAHGRKDAFNQMLVADTIIRSNLEDIALAFRRFRPHVVALQEADAPSWWSGGFSHVAFLAERAGFPWRAHAHNMDGWFATYGTALVARSRFTDTVRHTFAPSPPTTRKGFVLARLRWPGDPRGREVDVVSVHLDFSRRSVRERQITEMRTVLARRNRPTIILGDFNSDALQTDSALRAMLESSRFSVHRIDDAALATYGNKRLDWILISPELRFVDYRIVDEVLSDHALVVADVAWRDAPERVVGVQNDIVMKQR